MPERQRGAASEQSGTREVSADEAALAKAMVAVLRAGPDAAEMYDAFYELDALPAEVVRAELGTWIQPLPDVDALDPAARSALGLPPRALRLRVVSRAKDADIFDLGEVAEEQVRLAGVSWDGVDRPAEERLDGELEGNFAGTLERIVLIDEDAAEPAPMFDVVLFAEDSGILFAAGTTQSVGLIAYGKVELRDKRARVAIEAAVNAYRQNPDAALRPLPEKPVTAPTERVKSAATTTEAPPRPVASAPTPAAAASPEPSAAATPDSLAIPRPKAKKRAIQTAPEKSAPKKAAPKKSAAKDDAKAKPAATKKAAPKTTPSAKKSSTKKSPSTKKPSAKTSRKKASTKTPSTKKPSPKKPSPKKPSTKSSSPKKPSPKKPSAKPARATKKKPAKKKSATKKSPAKKKPARRR